MCIIQGITPHRSRCAFVLLAASLAGCSRDTLPAFPGIVLWAWESPQRLDFLNPKETGVAFLARTLTLRDGAIEVRPRLQPLRIPPRTALMAVVRIESTGSLPRAADVADALYGESLMPGVLALQIDYDAKLSQRPFYRELILETRRRVPAEIPIEITALASWCASDRWMTGLPVVEAIPMLFRMGADPWRPGDGLRDPLCRASVGVSTDEPLPKFPRGRRVFIFHSGPWSKAAYDNAVQEVMRWR
jgi:hypothetical protein